MGISSVIVFDVDLADYRSFKPESQSLVMRELQAPNAPSITLERMKSPSRDRIELFDGFGFLNHCQHCAKLRLVSPGNASRFAISPESLKLPIAKTAETHVKPYAVAVRASMAKFHRGRRRCSHAFRTASDGDDAGARHF